MTEDKYTPPTVSAFLAQLNKYAKDIGCDGKKTSAHSYPSSVIFRDEDYNYYELKEVEIEQHMGCGCETGFEFVLKKLPEDN